MSMLSCSGGEAVANEMLLFIDSKLVDKLKRPLTPADAEVLKSIIEELLAIKQACASGWY